MIFAASLGIPRNMTKAAVNIAKGNRFPCDVGIVNGERSFNYVAAFGGVYKGFLWNSHRILRMYLGIRLM